NNNGNSLLCIPQFILKSLLLIITITEEYRGHPHNHGEYPELIMDLLSIHNNNNKDTQRRSFLRIYTQIHQGKLQSRMNTIYGSVEILVKTTNKKR
ncbi:uncharacterized protein TM35_000262200, partial [Trypanosoma theileri]